MAIKIHDWMDYGNCRGATAEQIDELYDPADEVQRRAANQFCVGCPVVKECLQTALENNERYGVWGNTTETERRRIRRAWLRRGK